MTLDLNTSSEMAPKIPPCTRKGYPDKRLPTCTMTTSSPVSAQWKESGSMAIPPGVVSVP